MGARNGAQRRNESGANIAEFGMAFSAFFFVVVIPCINLIGFAASYAIASQTTQQTAEHISKSTSIKQTERIVKAAEKNLANASLFKTFRLTPAGESFKLELAVESLKGDESYYAINTKTTRPIDRSNALVRYRLSTSYNALPVIDLSSVPVINQVWIIGRATPIKQVLYREIEHPEYLLLSKN